MGRGGVLNSGYYMNVDFLCVLARLGRWVALGGPKYGGLIP